MPATTILPQTTKQYNRIDIIFWLVAAAVVLIGTGSFALSFNALLELATANGIPAHLAFIWPLIVDLSLVIYAASILTYQLLRVKPIYPIALTACYGVVTITGNILHAPPNPVAWFVAALPPISLLLATELLRELAKQKIDRLAAVDSLAELTGQAGMLNADIEKLQSEAATLTSKKSGLETELKALRSDKRRESYTAFTSKTRAAASAILTERPGVSGAELGRLLGKSDSTGRKLKKELLPAISGNGSG